MTGDGVGSGDVVGSGNGGGSVPAYADVSEGEQIAERTVVFTRADLVRYAGASGDFNVIHWSDRVATEVGLPSVIAHGMLTMARGANLVTEWVGDPGRVVEYSTRFAAVVPVPDDEDGASVLFRATLAKKLPDNRVRVDIDARLGAEKVLSMARAVVLLD